MLNIIIIDENIKIRRIKWMPRCLIVGRCGGPLFTVSTGSTGSSKNNYTNKVK